VRLVRRSGLLMAERRLTETTTPERSVPNGCAYVVNYDPGRTLARFVRLASGQLGGFGWHQLTPGGGLVVVAATWLAVHWLEVYWLAVHCHAAQQFVAHLGVVAVAG